MSKRKIGDCVYCGLRAKLTLDHVPPAGLFGNPSPTDLIKVPSCFKCNGGASRDDEYFKTVMVWKDRAGSHPEAVAIRSSVFRGLQMPQKTGFRHHLLRGMHLIRQRTPNGLYLGHREAFNVDLERLGRVVARITKGLHWHHEGKRIPPTFEVSAFAEDGFREMSPWDQERIREQIVAPVFSGAHHSIGRGVMQYWYVRATDRPEVSVWIYEFYQDVKFLALVAPNPSTIVQ